MSMKSKIIALRGEAFLKRSALRLVGGEEALGYFLRGKGYRTVLEIGTYRGCTAAAIAQHCERVVTVDLVRGAAERDDSSFDREALWSSLGLSNVAQRRVRDDAEKAAVVSALDFDFAFVDGAHDEDSVQSDFNLVKRCGRVLFHDYAGGKTGVAAVVDRLPSSQVEVHGIFALWMSA